MDIGWITSKNIESYVKEKRWCDSSWAGCDLFLPQLSYIPVRHLPTVQIKMLTISEKDIYACSLIPHILTSSVLRLVLFFFPATAHKAAVMWQQNTKGMVTWKKPESFLLSSNNQSSRYIRLRVVWYKFDLLVSFTPHQITFWGIEMNKRLATAQVPCSM